MSEHGGTVRYHRADWVGDVDPNYPWRVQFTPDDGPVAFSAEQGEMMGLTPPEPEPLVVTCNGHSVEVEQDEKLDRLIDQWGGREPEGLAWRHREGGHSARWSVAGCPSGPPTRQRPPACTSRQRVERGPG